MLKCIVVVLVMTAAPLTQSEAQSLWLGRPAVPTDSLAQSIAEAEERGSRHPPAVTNNAGKGDVEFPGSRERRCVNTDADAMRSGDFVAGPFDWYNGAWRQGYGKIWWHPDEMPSERPVLIVQAARLDEPAESRVYEATFVSWPSGPNESEATSIKFYPTGIRLPTVGRWMMVVTAGNNWGCFVLTVR
jgi:hypothetical protein